MDRFVLLWLVVWIMSAGIAYPASIVEDFTSITYLDSSNTTGDWNNALGLARGGLLVTTGGGDTAFNIGTGAEGDCVFSSDITGRTYNCRTMIVSGVVNILGSTPAIFRVKGAVSITGTLQALGSDGSVGVAGDSSQAGGTGFAGGGDGGIGGASTTLATTGGGTGGGTAGGNSNGVVVGDVGGGGGAGGSYGATALGANGTAGGGVVGGAAGAAGAAYGNQNTFNVDFAAGAVGGSGGGGGGRGQTINVVPPHLDFSGGSGGAGGGAIQISSGSTITVAGGAFILADGGNGGAGTVVSAGGGGGGSGGAIFLQALGQLTVSGTVRAIGGSAGAAGPSNGGAGGAGGDGRIRAEDTDGAIAGGGVVNPAAQFPSGAGQVSTTIHNPATTVIQSVGYDTNALKILITGVTKNEALNGGTSINYFFAESDDDVTYSAFVPEAQISTLTKRYIKFQIQITPGAGAPQVNSLTIDYTVLVGLDFESDIDCGGILLKNPQREGAQSQFLTLLLGFAFICLVFRMAYLFRRKVGFHSN